MSQIKPSILDYLTIMRFDHALKHVFILPGFVLAYLLRGVDGRAVLDDIVLGLLAAVLIASSNYTLNEWFDRKSDLFHPEKSKRQHVQSRLDQSWILIQWSLLSAVGILCAYFSSLTMVYVALVFILQGIIYNIPPLRTKDIAFIDVVSESVNNPIRLVIGWSMVDPATLPPASVLLFYWLGGAFLMAAKRLSEYREVKGECGIGKLHQYRKSFHGYSEKTLTASCFAYGLLSIFFLAIFLQKYRIEYILVVPFIVALFGQYIALALSSGSAAQHPEKLHNEHKILITVLLVVLSAAVASFIDLPILSVLIEQHFISLEN